MAIAALRTIFFFWLFFALPLALATPVKYCARKNYDVKVKGVEMNPDPVQAGKPAVFKIIASSGKEISEGSVIINVSYFGLPVHKETIDLCQETPCPVPAGDFVLSHEQSLPSFTPPGSYNLRMQIQDSSNTVLTCISFGFKITVGGSSVSAI